MNEFKKWLTDAAFTPASEKEYDFTKGYNRALEIVALQLDATAPRWSTVWPTKEGLYWFYGTTGMMRNEEPELGMAKVVARREGVWIHMDGELLWPARVRGIWLRIDAPELPKEF